MPYLLFTLYHLM